MKRWRRTLLLAAMLLLAPLLTIATAFAASSLRLGETYARDDSAAWPMATGTKAWPPPHFGGVAHGLGFDQGHWTCTEFNAFEMSDDVVVRQPEPARQIGDVEDFEVEIHRSGWPARCLQWFIVRRTLNGAPTETRGPTWLRQSWLEVPWMNASPGVLPGGVSFPDPSLERGLPIAPIWTGFLFNTLFYAALLYAAILALPLSLVPLRRRLRARRGRCPKCNYDLAGLTGPCPECGGER